MTGFTKLLGGRVTVSGALRDPGGAGRPELLQFSAPGRPVAVLNLTRRCNLACEHCYASAQPAAGGELSTGELRRILEDLAAAGSPVVLLSGGEPLLRGDIVELVRLARGLGLRPALSTNGTLLTPALAGRLREAGLAYAGVSLDGLAARHDRMRGGAGCFDRAVAALAAARGAGLRTGVRMTLTRHTAPDLEGVLDLAERLEVGRACIYHLVYAGRGRALAADDLSPAETRAAVEGLVRRARDWIRRDVRIELLTADNPADGPFLLEHVRRTQPERTEEVERLVRMAGGCSAGNKIACIDPEGRVRPCQFWPEDVGSVRGESFGTVWSSGRGALGRLRPLAASLNGRRCARCRYRRLCGGCRVRSGAASGSYWDDDPACYLTDEEIGI